MQQCARGIVFLAKFAMIVPERQKPPQYGCIRKIFQILGLPYKPPLSTITAKLSIREYTFGVRLQTKCHLNQFNSPLSEEQPRIFTAFSTSTFCGVKMVY